MTLQLYVLLHPVLLRLFGLFVLFMELLVHFKPELKTKLDKLIWTYRMRSPRGIPAYLEVDYEAFQGRSPIWIHAASGEYEYAKPLVRELKRRGELVFVTYFSPTYRSNIEKDPGVTASCPLPLDDSSEIRDLIGRLKPRCLLIARTDTWPNLLKECARAEVPTLLFSATFHALSGRVGGLAGQLTRATYPLLTAAHGVTEEDCELLSKFGVRDTMCAGDTRYDQVLARLEENRPLVANLRSRLHSDVLVAGSVWEEDLEQVLPSLVKEIQGHRNFSAILVPHEISVEKISKLSSQLKARGLQFATYSQLEARTNSNQELLDVLIVDKIGILAELYQLGRLAFIGGSFRKTVHSVMEPLAAGCVCFFGPLHVNNREAIDFQSEQIANFAFPPAICVQNSDDFSEKLHAVRAALQSSPQSIAEQIKDKVRTRGGATKKALEWIEGLS